MGGKLTLQNLKQNNWAYCGNSLRTKPCGYMKSFLSVNGTQTFAGNALCLVI
jgi:hypothetical protein